MSKSESKQPKQNKKIMTVLVTTTKHRNKHGLGDKATAIEVFNTSMAAVSSQNKMIVWCNKFMHMITQA